MRLMGQERKQAIPAVRRLWVPALRRGAESQGESCISWCVHTDKQFQIRENKDYETKPGLKFIKKERELGRQLCWEDGTTGKMFAG